MKMISSALRKYLIKQKKDFVRAFANPAQYPMGVINREDSTKNIYGSTSYWDPKVRKKKCAFIREIRVGSEVYKEYWVAVKEKSSKNYRTWFKKFIQREYGVAFNTVPSELQADHVLSRAFAEEVGIQYVRMAFIWNKYNTNSGWAVEQGFVDLARKEVNRKRMYLIDYSIIMKPLGIFPPKNVQDFQNQGGTIANKISKRANINDPSLVLNHLTQFYDEKWYPVLLDDSKKRTRKKKKKKRK